MSSADAGQNDDKYVSYCAAVTVHFNQYKSREGHWAQILNMSTRRERHGHGTVLMAGVQELLRREGVEVIVLYPADNGRAMPFWSSIGFGDQGANGRESFLPPEELVPYVKGGPLLTEFDPGSGHSLPRWEKRLISRDFGPSGSASCTPGGSKRGRKRLPPTSSIGGTQLEEVHASILELKHAWKIETDQI